MTMRMVTGLLCLCSVSFGCATQGDMLKVQREQVSMRSKQEEIYNKQARMLAQLTKMQALLGKQVKIFNSFKRKGRFDIANIGENVSQLRTDHQALLGKYSRLKEDYDKLKAQHKKMLQAYAARFGDPTASPNAKGKIEIQVITPEALFNASKALFDAGKFRDAAGRFKVFIKKYPTHALTDNAHILLGDSYYNQKNYVEASFWYDKVRRNFKSGDQVDVALLKLGDAHFKMGVCDAGKAYLRVLRRRKYRNSPHASTARNMLRNARRLCRKR